MREDLGKPTEGKGNAQVQVELLKVISTNKYRIVEKILCNI